MSSSGPLDHPALRAIDHRLDRDDLTGAQEGLASLGASIEEHGDAVAFLTTRLLHKRRRITSEQVAERLGDLLARTAGFFPEAQAMFEAAQSGSLETLWNFEEWTRVHGAPRPPSRASRPPSEPVRPPSVPPPAIDAAPAPSPIPQRPPSPFPGSSASERAPEPARSMSPATASAPPPLPSSPPLAPSPAPLAPSATPLAPSAPPVPSSAPRAFTPAPEPRATSSEQPDSDARPRSPSGRELEVSDLSMPVATITAALDDMDRARKQQYDDAAARLEHGGHATDAQASGARLPDLPDLEVPARRRAAPSTGPSLELGTASFPAGIDPIAVDESPEREPIERRPSGELKRPRIPRAAAVPAFSERPREPSYAPPRRPSPAARKSEPPPATALRSSSSLPREAGRYSETPAAPEAFEEHLEAPRRRRPSSVPPKRPSVEDAAAAQRIRSVTPPLPEAQAHPSLFEIAALVDSRRWDQALQSLDRLGRSETPEHALMRARALDGSGRRGEAIALLDRLGQAPLLDPELRAGVARLLLEAGRVDGAFEQADQAYQDDPSTELVRLTYAWTAVRVVRRTPRRSPLLDEASRILGELQIERGPHAALKKALEACVEAERGDPKRAIAMAQRALGALPDSPDALGAVAIAAARLGRTADAEQAWLRMLDVSFEEAEAVVALIEGFGVSISDASPNSAGRLAKDAVWEPAEIALVNGDTDAARDLLGQLVDQRLGQLAGSVAQDLPSLATVAASVLSTAPVFAHFAPWDLSLWSVARLEAAVSALHGRAARRESTDPSSLDLLLGVYLGEALRQSHRGKWVGTAATARRAQVVCERGQWHPVELVVRRRVAGVSASLAVETGTAVSMPGSPAWNHRVVNPQAPPVPWVRGAWPVAATMEALGRAVPTSALALYAKQMLQQDLDRSLESLDAVDLYLDLVANPGAPPEPAAAWAARAATLMGAYVGEVLRARLGGRWIDMVDATGPDRLRVEFPGGVRTAPVAHVLRRLDERGADTLGDYAARTTSSVERSGR